jgi:hypothetical protein
MEPTQAKRYHRIITTKILLLIYASNIGKIPTSIPPKLTSVNKLN